MKSCKTFRPPGSNLRLRLSRIDEQRRSTAQSHRAEQKSQKTTYKAGKILRHTRLLGQDNQDTSDKSCGDGGLPMQYPREILGPPEVQTTTPIERWNGAQ